MELIVYKASAGSGKTFTLAIEYIKLLIFNPHAYKYILAVSFTNKATAEMKDRILGQLNGIRMGDEESKDYLNKIAEATQLSEDEIRKRAGEALNYIIHDYSHFRIDTIDSFFQIVLRNLARELNLAPNLNIELDAKTAVSDAVDSLFAKLTLHSPIMAQLLEYINEQISDEHSWNVTAAVKRFGENITKEEYMDKGKELRRHIKEYPNLIRDYQKILKGKREKATELLRNKGQEFFDLLLVNNITTDDFKRKSSGISSYFNKLKNGTFSSNIVLNKTTIECLEDENNWVNKTGANRNDVLVVVRTTLMPLLVQTERLRSENVYTINSCESSLAKLYQLQLLSSIDEEMRNINEERNRFLLSDTNTLLNSLISNDDPSFIYEKVGSTIRNMMIDEFQDTSRMQWNNFRILLTEGLSQGNNSLIVGDVKQSIYRWRNGDWNILNNLAGKFGAFDINSKSLSVNYRSKKRIIDFNNELFEKCKSRLNNIYFQEQDEQCTKLLNAYHDVHQESKSNVDDGFVKVQLLSNKDEEELSMDDLTCLEVGKEIARLMEQGVNVSDIAILGRKSKHLALIANYIDKELHLPIISNEAFLLEASVAVNMLIDALSWINNPQDSISLTSLIINYQTKIMDYKGPIENLITGSLEDFLPIAFIEQVEQFKLLPLYDLLEQLYILLKLGNIHDQDAYIFSFFDKVSAYLKDNSSDIQHFLDYWADKMHNESIPGSEMEGIRMMTIHKAKGLEFHTVIIPFCSWKMENDIKPLLWCHSDEEPYSMLDIVPVTYGKQLEESVYKQAYLDERLQMWVDNLNLLYVALTRASKNLIIFGEIPGTPLTVSSFFDTVLPDFPELLGGEYDEESHCYSFGEIIGSTKASAKEHRNILLQEPDKLPVEMLSEQHEVFFRQSNRSTDFIKGIDDEEYENQLINKGRLLHTLFAEIQSKEDAEPAIVRLVFEGIISTKQQEEELKEIVCNALALPEVQDWYSGNWEVVNECDILYKEENQKVNKQRPDRVMRKGDRLIVVDFKFGRQQEKHYKQVRNYMKLFKEMSFMQVEGYLWYVSEAILKEVKA